MKLRWILAGAAAAAMSAAPSASLACSGTALIGVEQTDDPSASVIFSGTAVRVEDPRLPIDPVWSSGDGMRWTFVVDDVERGTVGDRMTVQTARANASCGFSFALGARYRVVASDRGQGLWVWSGNGSAGLPSLALPPAVEGATQAGLPEPWVLVLIAAAIVASTVAFIRVRRMDAA